MIFSWNSLIIPINYIFINSTLEIEDKFNNKKNSSSGIELKALKS